MFKRALATLCVLAAFITLISLGIWQIDRLAWKNELIARLDAQNNADPSSHPVNLDKPTEFERGFLKGRFVQTDKAPVKIAPRTHKKQVGSHIIRPFKTNDGHYILVNNGWVSADWPHAPKIHFEPITIKGHLRPPEEKSIFTPPNSPESSLWYHLDIAALSEYYALEFVHYVFYNEGDYTLPVPFDGLPYPRNKHLQYALFWFGMAGLLLLLVGFILLQKRRD